MTIILVFFAGWLLAYGFYRRRRGEGDVLYEKLNPDARRFIILDEREKLGLTDVIDLFHEKIIDEHLDLLSGPFPYKRCPKCGSQRVQRFVLRPDGTVDTQRAPATPPVAGEQFTITCRSCGYRDQATVPEGDPSQD